jgi:biotin operon repressor
MSDDTALATVVRGFKALSDPTRLRMIAAMVDRARCGQDLSAEVGVSPATVSHHLKILGEAGLLTEERRPPFTFYRLDPAALARMVRGVSTPGRVRELAGGHTKPEDPDELVLRNFFDGPRLRSIPAQRRKKQIILAELVRRLPRRREYPEADLNCFIEVMHPDFCTLRRELIMEKLMERTANVYRLTERGSSLLAVTRA